ncbi:breast cancer type 2 susceptibility protein [Thunnus maccoyii]|uniref:breast cancer type 2 susceptibility protein n=1 Tax=Thunnus maccoyii TaxID=8240 RepID=UPI001C4D77DF|nr:breast cancer type 2 susceptibility protein [Thunnus maccoyii]XP_042270284.1 breast cancer type 2 susceptibility protein [Thunnus maccoyii]
MDLTSESMYDTFKDEIWRELGPLDPDWFDVLTAQAVTTEGNVSDQDDLCANQEGNFKTPFDETAVESQLFSTPKVFRRCRVVSPETKDEQSFTAEPEKETLPWTTASPYFIQISKEQMPGTKYGGIQPQESFDLLHTPQKSPVSYAKQISESLGAHIHPDISWTSSLNTPPAVPSTLILSKTEESPCPVSFSEDKSVVFVRKLFPSLSNASQVGSVSPKNNDLLPPTIQDGAGSPEAGQNPESHNSPSQSSLNQSGVWRQKLPDAIEDGEIRSTVASVLDGAENVLSIFFSNSSSALRKVKTDRMKRKQIISAKEHGCSSTHISTKNMATSSEQRTADRQLCRVLSSPHLKSPVRTGDMGTTQWSPLSLSEIPPSTVVTSCHNNNPAAQVENNCLTEQLQSDSGSSQLVRPSLKITDSGFIKKKRHFIYTVETSKPQVQERETHSQRIDSSPVQELNVKNLPNAQDEADCCNISTKTVDGKNEMRQRENVTEENLPPSVQAKVQDVDMSQLCRAFAQDFSQMSDPVRLSEAAEATPQNGFSPSVCLSALKRAKRKARQASLQHDHDGVSNRRRVFAANQNNSIIERTICDSGFQSAVADITHLTAFSALPSSEKESQTQQWTTPFQSPNKENRKAHLEDTLYGAETDAKLSFIVKENQTLDPGRESEVQTKTTLTHPSSSAKGAVDNINCIPVSGQVHGSLPEKTIVSLPSVHASGFKTASNKGIRISSANLERAKRLFEQTEGEGLNDQPTKCGHDTKDDINMSHGSVKTTASDSNHPSSSSEKFRDISCQLTASQKADVTELCTLLEETDSQFEFKELKTATLNQQCQDNATSPQKAVKELDPDFLTGIDFDDSFSLDAEKHVAVTMMPGKMALVSDKTYDVTSKPTEMSYSSGLKKENFSTGTVPSSSKHIAEGRSCIMSSENLDRAEHNEISKPSNKNPLTLSVGFKTAGGNVLRVSKKCLSNARALFADLEESLVTEKNSPDKQNGENYTKTVHNDSVDNNTDKFFHHKEDNSKFTSYSNDTEERIQSCFSNMKESVCSDRQVSGMRDEGATTSFANSKMDIAACQSAFQMASGRGISISAKAMQKANSVFRDCDVVDSNDGMSEKHNNLETLPGSFNHKKNLSKFKSVHGIKANVSEEPVKRCTEFENVNSEPSARRTEVLQHDMEIDNFGVKNTPALIKSAPFLGNQCSTEKPFSSPLCTTSKNISSSAINDLSDGGFCTASGKKVSVSADAMTKAACLLNEIQTHEDTDQQMKEKQNSSRIGLTNQSSGFQTAGGKGVVISSAALKKAKSLLTEYDGAEDKVSVYPKHSKIAVHGPTSRNSGFLAASGKPVAFSSEALKKAKTLFDDISFSSEIPAVSATRKTDQKQENAQNKEKMHCGFSTAGGTIAHVSQQNLSKAKNLLKEFDDDSISVEAMQEADAFFKDCDVKDSNVSDDAMIKAMSLLSESATFEDTNKQLKQKEDTPQNVGFQTASGKGVAISSAALKKAKSLLSECEDIADKSSAKPTHSKMPFPGPSSRNSGFLAASGKPVAFSSEALKKAKTLFDDISFSSEIPAVSATRKTDQKQENAQNKEKMHCGFSTAGGTIVHVSQQNLLKAKNLLKEFDDDLISVEAMQEADAFFKDCDVKDSNVSDDAMIKAMSLLSESATFEDTNKQLKQNEDTPQNVGFQTASGKGVAISSAALKKAKSLLSECEDVADKRSAKPTHSKMPFPGSSSRNSGFLAASGKPVAFSSEALQKAKTLFDDISLNTDISAVSSTRENKKQENAQNKEKMHCGFSTAGGAKVCVSQQNLLKAKNLFKEFDDDSVSLKAMQEADAFFKDCDIKDSNVPDDAMIKAKSVLSESATFEDTNKQLKQKEDTPQNVGFHTASGKGVAISSAALKKAKSLLSECEDFADKSSAKPTHSKMPFPDPPPRNSGFLAASGKPVAFSSEALKKAKALFDDISSEIPAVSDTRKNDKKQENAQNIEKIHCGFSTSGGAIVRVSQQNLLKAKNLLKEFDDDSVSLKTMRDADALFKDCDVKDSSDEMSVKPQKSSENVNKKKILPTFKNVQGVTVNFSEEPVNGHTEFENVKAGPDVHHEKMLRHNDLEIQKDVNNPLALTNALFLHANQFLKPLSSPLCTTAKKLGYSAVDELSSGGGFCTASGKKVSVSDDAMAKAKSLLSESATFEDTNKQLKQKEDTPQIVGFQTADGKGVAISSAALKKAKSLLSECEDVANKSSAKPTHFKMPYPGPPPRNSGFLAASGKPVAFSSEALQKAKALFDDISLNTDVPAVSDTWKNDKKHEDAQNNKEKIHCGFTTAGGAKVQVSQINLLKAKNLLREFDNDSVSVKDGGEFADSSSYSTSLIATHKSDLSKDVKRTSNSNLVTTSDKDMPAEESALQVVKPQFSSRETDSENKIFQNSSVQGSNFIKEKALTDAFKFEEDKFAPSGVRNLHREKRPNMLDHEINQTSSNEKLEFTRTEESSVLSFQSLNFSGCTETQQKLFAQEALDCTKALLEDEGLAGQSLSMTFENMPLQENPKSSNRSVEEQKTTGKRLAEDADMTGQPPLKRRLLDEFDRTLDSPRQSTLQPERSCATGVMKDRRVFKYSVSLHPNITRPHSDGKNYMVTRLQKETQHSAPGDSKSAHSKIPAFVPPFLKNSKTETHKNNMVKDNRRTPSAFVPPFKKQRTIVQESCSKPHEEEDKHHHLSAMPSNSSTFVPPTKKTSRQSTTDVTGNKSREDIHPVALVGNTKDDHVENHKIPVGCGTEDSAAEASGVVDTLSRSQEIQTLENIELARDMQDMRIRKKKRQTIRPLPGSLFLTKTSGVSRIPLKDAVNGKPPAKYTQKQLYGYGVHQHVSEITGDNAQSFRFSLQQFLKQEAFINEGGVQLADGGWLIPSKNGTAGKEEFYRALCDTPGVDPKLISEEWVYNHYRWIVWKQASMERSFPGTMGSLCLTPEQVLLQLKYRYDVEVDHSRRPALRKIMEKDDTAAKTLVLCVCGVVSRGHSPTRQSRNDAKTPQGADAKAEKPCAVVWLTDGWYAIKAQLDDPLTAMLHKGPLAVGGKLIIHGAQLVGSQDACSPLEAPESLMLKIYANSSRPARWDTKLGFYRDPRPFLLPLSCLYSNGGPVGCVDMVILRSYPIQWMERKPDGGVVFRSVRAEEKEVRRYNSNKQKAMEIVFAKIQAEFEKEEKGNNKPQRRRRTISRQDIASLQDGEELYEAVGDDPAYLEAHLSERQLETLHTYRRSLMERKQAELQDRYRRALENAEDNEGSCPKRDVTPVSRLCIADSMNQSSSVYQLNMWRPSLDLQSMLKEGCRYKVYNLTTSDGKKRSGIETVQLTGNKKTQFQDLQASQEWLSACFQPRVSAAFVDLQNPEFQPLCGEVDLIGYVITIIDGQGSSPAFYMVDGKLNFVKVRCFSSLAQSGLEDVVKPRELLALSNLQLRGQSTFPTPVVYAGDLTIASTNPKETHLQESLGQLRNLVQGQENFFLTAEEKLSYLIKSVGMSSISSPALQPRTPAVPQQTTAERRQDSKTSVTSQQPIRSLGSFTPVSRNPPPGNCSTEKDPKSLKRRRALDYLSRIPSPPPVPLLGSAASPYVNKTFNPPRRSGTPSTLKTVQTPARRPVVSPAEDEWVKDEELAMIDTQALHVGT